jgi:acetyl-CoA acetyltransferase
MLPETPIIIGVADIKNRSTAIASAKEPATLMLEAIDAALADACTSSSPSSPSSASVSALRAAIDSIDVVRTWTWPYADLPGLLAERLHAGTKEAAKSAGQGPGKVKIKWQRYSEHGGDKPGKLVDEAARRIASGEVKVCVVTGGEALASRGLSFFFLFSCGVAVVVVLVALVFFCVV